MVKTLAVQEWTNYEAERLANKEKALLLAVDAKRGHHLGEIMDAANAFHAFMFGGERPKKPATHIQRLGGLVTEPIKTNSKKRGH